MGSAAAQIGDRFGDAMLERNLDQACRREPLVQAAQSRFVDWVERGRFEADREPVDLRHSCLDRMRPRTPMTGREEQHGSHHDSARPRAA